MNGEQEDLLDLVERMKIGLTSYATDGGWDAEEYKRLRKTLLASPVAESLPSFIRRCRSLDDFWSFIKGKFKHYQERRDFLIAEFDPSFERLEEGPITEFDEYEMGELIGRGGFGRVHKIHHRRLDIEFAIKLFSPFFSEHSDGSIDRFFREARILFKLNHPNIIRVYHVGMYKRQPYIRMELFKGSTLNEVLKKLAEFPRNERERSYKASRKVLFMLTARRVSFIATSSRATSWWPSLES